MIKTVVNEEKEMFFGSLWIFPLIPISAIFVLLLVYGSFAWFLLLVFVVWFCVLGWIYYCVHETITIQEEHFVLLRKKKRKVILFSEIVMIEEMKYISNLKPCKYRIYIKENSSGKMRMIVISNSLLRGRIKSLFRGVNIVTCSLVD